MSGIIEGGSDSHQPLVAGVSTKTLERLSDKYRKAFFVAGCAIPLFIVTVLATGATVFMLVGGIGDRLMGR